MLPTKATLFEGRHLIDRISDWPNPRGFTKGVRFVCLNRYIQVDQKAIRSNRNSVNPGPTFLSGYHKQI